MVSIKKNGAGDTYAKHLVSKIVPDPNRGRGVVDHGGGNFAPSHSTIQEMARRMGQKETDAENIFATLPDTELAMLILVSSIISPNEMRDAEFTWRADVPSLGPDLTMRLIEILRRHFEEDYQLKKLLPEILKSALFKTGSYPIAVLAESAIDDVINGRTNKSALESLKNNVENGTFKGIGILGPSNKTKNKSAINLSLEDIFSNDAPEYNVDTIIDSGTIDGKTEPMLTITDNMELLKMPELAHARNKNAVTMALHKARGSHMAAHIGTEDYTRTGNILKTTYSGRNNYTHGSRTMLRMTNAQNASRAPIGHPVPMRLPSSIVPIHVPSNPKDHLGYLVPIDAFGNPLDFASESTHYEELQQMSINAKSSESSRVLARSRMLQEAQSGLGADAKFNELYASYSAMLENEILERLHNGAYSSGAEVERIDEFYRLMLSRTLAGHRTQLLYLPAEIVTYFAYDYDRYGIGRSLLDKSKILAGIRSTLLFSNTMAAIKNSVPRRNLNITIPEEDLEPEKTVELAIGEFQRVNTAGFPVATTAPRDILDGLRNASVNVNVQGNPRFPEIGVSVEDVQSSRATVDSDLDENLKKTYFQLFGLTMDQIDSTANIEFATTQLNSSLLYTRRISLYQETTHGFLKDHISKYTTNSGALMAEMIQEIVKYRDELAQSTKDTPEDGNVAVTDQPFLEPGPDTQLDFDESATPPPAEGEELPEPGAGEDLIPEADGEERESPYSIAEIRGTTRQAAVDNGVIPETNTSELEAMSNQEVIETLLDSLSITLPPPDSTLLSNQLELYNEYSSALDAFLPAYVNEEVLELTMGEDGREMGPVVIAVAKNFFQRQFMAQNNIMPELQGLVSFGEDNENMLDLLEAHELHKEGIAATIGLLITTLKSRNTPPEGADDQGGGYGGYDEGADGGDFGGGFDDDFADLDAIGGEETPEDTDTETPAEEPEAEETETPTEPEAEETPAEEPAPTEEEEEPKPEEPEA